MTNSDWISIAAIALTVFMAFVGWMTAIWMRAGTTLQEIKQLGTQVAALAVAFDSQDRRIDHLATRLTIIETRQHVAPITGAGDHAMASQ